MRSTVKSTLLAVCASSVLIGCAQDGTSLLTTGSTTVAKKAETPPIDPACLALQNRIALLQDEGTITKVEQAATGTTSSVMIKRSALSKVAELNKANDEFRARCSKLPVAATLTPTNSAAVGETQSIEAQQPAQGQQTSSLTQ